MVLKISHMTRAKMIGVRIADDLLARIEAHRQRLLGALPASVDQGALTTSDVIRALCVESLERHEAADEKPAPKASKPKTRKA